MHTFDNHLLSIWLLQHLCLGSAPFSSPLLVSDQSNRKQHEGVSYPWPSQGRFPSRAFKNYLGLSCEGSQVYFLNKTKTMATMFVTFPYYCP